MTEQQSADDKPDLRGPAIVVTGSVLGGFEFFGPFESIDSALEWYGASMFGIVKDKVTIALLKSSTSVPRIDA